MIKNNMDPWKWQLDFHASLVHFFSLTKVSLCLFFNLFSELSFPGNTFLVSAAHFICFQNISFISKLALSIILEILYAMWLSRKDHKCCKMIVRYNCRVQEKTRNFLYSAWVKNYNLYLGTIPYFMMFERE